MKIALYWICFIILTAYCTALKWQNFEHIKSKTPAKDQELAVRNLISRLLPGRASEFSVIVDPDLSTTGDVFMYQTVGDELVLSGTTGVAAAWAFHHYLKYYCKAHISWSGNQLKTIPKPLPVVPKSKFIVPNRFRYYQNVCTSSYSFVWWNWTRWEQEIDWMVMNGINLPLAFTAQEAIWQRVYLKLGLTQKELDEHFGGAAFLAWSRMGNVDGWGGPLPNPSWYQDQLALQNQILKRMRSFGMTPVLPAFAGHIPKALTRVFPNASISTLSHWGHFSSPYVPTYLLDPADPLFQSIGKAFIEEQISEYNGTDHVYNGDTFNEMQPKTSSTSYLAQASKAVYDAITSADEKGIWLMQGWLFFSDPAFWQPAQVKAYLQGVPQGKMIVLDLYAEIFPVWGETKSFYGQPFIWCMLNNFGGNIGMHGTLQNIATEPVKALAANNTMVGIGITPEGIETNYVVYELMLEMGWRDEQVEAQEWLKGYATRRYGAQNDDADSAWENLRKSVYEDSQGAGSHCRAVPVNKPDFNLKPDIWYEPDLVLESWDNMVEAAKDLNDSSTFRYDLVDLTRQALQVISISYYKDLIVSYQAKNRENFNKAAENILLLINNMDLVLKTNEYFLLGRWLNAAKRLATTSAGEKLLEFNARNQITTWGPHENIEDYANKMWSGLLSSLYHTRWSIFVDFMTQSLDSGKPFNKTSYNQAILTAETQWNTDNNSYPEHPQGDTLTIVTNLYEKYRKHSKVF
ncbi:alpha-N-acetylglucosaminidase-like [Dendronephthya gigantea]|uniref:alpha-N-acetylglucosaminidase-like n=1 Tax=Dendronephthya gigantea TaxID=151771 RepID=UPI001068EA97|nr:alpha-N-acetylglucosaminidase-like [Dendronephthya gigantea]